VRRLYIAADLADAHLVAGMLRIAGIEARVFNEHAQGAFGELPFGETFPEVWIENEADLERAEDILDDYERESPGQPPRRCAACGEESPAEFDVCWHCGRPLE
jgi:hypothetical protein